MAEGGLQLHELKCTFALLYDMKSGICEKSEKKKMCIHFSGTVSPEKLKQTRQIFFINHATYK